MSDNLIEESVERLFSEQVNRDMLEQAEQGEFPHRLWQLVLDSGFVHLMAAETAGGIEADWETAFSLFTALGYYQVPLPLAESSVAHLLLSAGAQPSTKALTEAPITLVSELASAKLQVEHVGDQVRLTGTLDAVPWARWSQAMVVGLSGAQLALVRLNGSGLTLSPRVDLSRMPADRIELKGVTSEVLFDNPWPAIPFPVLTLGAATRAAMMAGALEFALDQAVQYAKDRIQFGQPIGKYQAIQQQLAYLAGEFACVRVAALVACRDLPSVRQSGASSAEFSVAVAKTRAGDAASKGTAIAHQVHGAIGFTYEHALNFATRRLWAWRNDFGTSTWWSQRLGNAFIYGRSQQFWPALTDRRLPGEVQSPLNRSLA